MNSAMSRNGAGQAIADRRGPRASDLTMSPTGVLEPHTAHAEHLEQRGRVAPCRPENGPERAMQSYCIKSTCTVQ